MADISIKIDFLQKIFGECSVDGNTFFCREKSIPIRNGVIRFTPDESYSSGNFSKLREKHAQLQLDSVNGTTDRAQTILRRSGWTPEFFKGKTVLECGCGAGADTEVLLSFGARVVSVDLAGLDVCSNNLKEHPNLTLIQASIMDLPFLKHSFDIVWCHRVIMHTPDPEATLNHILSFVKEEGAAFVHSYARSWQQMLSWKYVMRPFTKRLPSEQLYRDVERWAPKLFRLTNKLRRVHPEWLGKLLFSLAYHLVPIRNYRFEKKFEGKSDDFILEYAIHDTFDCLSPAYDKPLSKSTMMKAAQRHLLKPWEVTHQGANLLRSKV